MTEFEELSYKETFNSMYCDIMNKKENRTLRRDELEALLKSLYVSEGNNWVGQSEIKQLRQAATIAACEVILSEWN
jgi:hypothetical protein